VAHRITLLALNTCFGSNIVGTIDMLWTANLVAGRLDPPRDAPFEWQVLSPHGEPVSPSNGYRLAVDGDLDRAPPGKVVIIPAFGSPQPDVHIEAVKRHARLLPWLRAQYESGATLAATCSGSFLLAESGLLDGRPATTSWWLAPAFAQRYPKVHLDPGSMLTEGERLICSGTGMSHLDLTLHLIAKYGGRDLARLCAKYAVLDSQRRSQAPYVILNYARHYDPLIVKAEKWIKQNLHRDFDVEEIAANVAASPRTLTRHFKESTGDSPQVFVQKIRVEMSKALLESTQLRMDAILERVGYSDDSAFRRLFKKYTGLSPREYRHRFGVGAP
jgi:transcriptional regulator GlxA family with amidase domain